MKNLVKLIAIVTMTTLLVCLMMTFAAADEKILWIVGYRISDDLKVSDSTVNLVRFTLKKK